MGKAPVYFSETITIGPNTYLMEVKRSQRGQKYFLITKTNALPEEQQAVVVFSYYMEQFAKMIERASDAVHSSVPEIEPRERSWAPKPSKPAKRSHKPKTPGPSLEAAKTKKHKRKKKAKANPPEFNNSGKPWSQEENELLAEQYQSGASMETLMKLFKRRSTAIEVRLYKLGFQPSKE